MCLLRVNYLLASFKTKYRRTCKPEQPTSRLVAGFGPETITAHNLRVGRYRYRVSEYKGADDNRASLLASKAQVTVYTATDVRVFEIKHSGAGAGFIRVRTPLLL